MRFSILISVAALLPWAVGCTLDDFDEQHRHEVDVWMTRTLHNEAGENAIITQRTLYPYHFFTNSDSLTPLGRKTLEVLSGHYRRHPGPLNVRKGDASVALYQSRVETVKATLEERGVDTSLVPIRDATPSGDGMWSEEVIAVRRRAAAAREASPTSADSSTSSSSSGSSGSSSAATRSDN